MRKVLRTAAAVLGTLFLGVVALELGVRGLVAARWLKTPAPIGFDEPYWVGNRDDFGVWRHPNAEFHHVSACFEATYRTNDVGARDVPRPRAAAEPRVIVLGDSFTEGWGVDVEKRWSSRLEQATGVPQLNFGMAHFSPYQSYLVYRDLAKEFSHEAVVLAVLPVNDFADLDHGWASGKQADYLYRYRPYLVPEGDGFRRFDWREPVVTRWLRRGSYAWNALLAAWPEARPAPVEAPAPQERATPAVPSFFYDASEAQIALLEKVLTLLAEEARGKEVAVVLLPGLRDLRRHAFSGDDPLSPRLERFGQEHGIRVVSLLAPMAEYSPHWSTYYFACDYHFSPEGHAVAATLLTEALSGWFESGTSSRP